MINFCSNCGLWRSLAVCGPCKGLYSLQLRRIYLWVAPWDTWHISGQYSWVFTLHYFYEWCSIFLSFFCFLYLLPMALNVVKSSCLLQLIPFTSATWILSLIGAGTMSCLSILPNATAFGRIKIILQRSSNFYKLLQSLSMRSCSSLKLKHIFFSSNHILAAPVLIYFISFLTSIINFFFEAPAKLCMKDNQYRATSIVSGSYLMDGIQLCTTNGHLSILYLNFVCYIPFLHKFQSKSRIISCTFLPYILFPCMMTWMTLSRLRVDMKMCYQMQVRTGWLLI